jgi:hypothetical protein
MKKLILILILFSTLAGLNAQSKPSLTTTTEPKWEYLVATFGKTYFSSENKLLAYKNIGLMEGQEGVILQSNLDVLGRFGWEVVGIVGSIGGDQQIVLKRTYDPERIKKDRELIAQEEKKQAELELTRSKEEEAWLAKQKDAILQKKVLVDLDAIELAERQQKEKNEYQNMISNLLKEALSNFLFTYTFKADNDKTEIFIIYDLTEQFLKENTYRRSEIETFISDQVELIQKSCEILNTEITLLITGNITFMKSTEAVYSSYHLGSLIEGEWMWF